LAGNVFRVVDDYLSICLVACLYYVSDGYFFL
jgi:hypothetical protein